MMILLIALMAALAVCTGLLAYAHRSDRRRRSSHAAMVKAHYARTSQ